MKTRLFWFCALVTIANALTSAGFSLAALASVGEAHTYALYGASRSVALALAAIGVVAFRWQEGLGLLR